MVNIVSGPNSTDAKEFNIEEALKVFERIREEEASNYSDNEETALLIIKPDAVRRDLGRAVSTRLYEILNEIGVYRKRFKMSFGLVTKEQAQALYQEHKAKPFYSILCEFMTSGDSMQFKVVGPAGMIVKLREKIGATKVCDASPGTIRHDFGIWDPESIHENVIHCSDSPESGERETKIFFG